MRAAAAACAFAGVLAGAAAQQVPSPDPSSTWNRRASGAGDYRVVMELSGREELSKFMEPPASAEDLQSICTAKRQSIDGARNATSRYLDSLLAAPAATRDVREIAWTRKSLGQLWSYDGDMAHAIAELEAARASLTSSARTDAALKSARTYLAALLGVAYLRKGELDNCVHGHAAASCIVPIAQGGRHGMPEGSRGAIRFLTEYLSEHPDDLDMRWLLNVAYMTLGLYPASVPKQYLIDPAALQSAEDPGRFTDIASDVGLGAPGHAGGIVVEDLDGDRLLDVAFSSVDPCEPLRVYHQNADGTFVDRAAQAGLGGQLGGINMTATDYNNDGQIDLFVMRGGWEYPMRNSLLRNNGDGTFTDVTRDAGLSSGRFRTHTAAWADFDNDGLLDVFVGHEEAPSSLFRNRGDGTFVDVAAVAGVARTAFTKAAAWGDYDNDGYPDLYVSNYTGENFLYHNERNGTFSEHAKELGVEKPIMSFPAWFFDYDNDGLLDLFVANFVPSVTEFVKGLLKQPRQAETLKLYRNTGGGKFEDVTAATRLDRVTLTMGANFGDIDNDGFVDMYLGTGAPSYAALVPNIFLRNHDGKYFVDVTTATGTGHLQKGHGVAFADIDRDGNLDLLENIGGFVIGDAYNRVLFRNPGHPDNNWLRVRLIGVKTNHAAVGAKIKLTLDDGSIRYAEVNSGGSFGASPFEQHFGLGRNARVKTLEVIWPASKTRQVFSDVAANREIAIREFEQSLFDSK